jgi:NAD(P)-dependent dehydrogenase (short-subunit alcohol dehydrogenase family)
MSGMEGRVALVTGAGSGIGRESAMRFSAKGASVVVADIDPAMGAETAALIEASGGAAYFIEVDVTAERNCSDLIAEIVRRFERLDFAHNNAGITSSGKLLDEYTSDAWGRTIDIDLKSVWLCMKYELAVMRQQGHGAIVNTSSIAGLIGYLHSAPYTAAKHGVIGLTRSGAVDYGHLGIRVNAVCPGPVETPMLAQALEARGPGAADWYLRNTPMGRFARLSEVADAVVWLASDEASFITGQAIAVDGGWTAQ